MSQSQELERFLESCRSEETKKHYSICLKKYLSFAGNGKLSFSNPNPKLIEEKIIEFIISLKKQGKSYRAIVNYIAPVKSLYAINGVVLNTKKIEKFFPESRKIKIDRAYTHEEIAKLLGIADERMRVVILLLASSGIRIGAAPFIKLRHLQDRKLVVYENTNEMYHTYITGECQKAIDFYLDMRSRYGEKLTDESYLIREQFDVSCPAKPKRIEKTALQWKIRDLCRRCGINVNKKEVALAHGMRKFFRGQLVNSKANPEIREMLLGHKIGLASAYYKPTEEEMYAEYEKAIDALTIDPSQRLQRKIETLEIEKSRMDRIELKFQLLEKQFNERKVKRN